MASHSNCWRVEVLGEQCTVKPPNNAHVGTSHLVHYREVVLYSEVLIIWEKLLTFHGIKRELNIGSSCFVHAIEMG